MVDMPSAVPSLPTVAAGENGHVSHSNRVYDEVKQISRIVVGPPVINAKGEGAVGDGVTDDTDACITTIEKARSVAQGGLGAAVAYLPGPIHLLSDSLLIYPGVHIRGSGSGLAPNPGTVLKPAVGMSDDVIKSFNIPTGDWLHWASIKNLAIEGADQTAGCGIHLRRMGENTTIDEVYIQNCYSHGVHIQDDSTPMKIGFLSVHNNGRDTSGAGLCLEQSGNTHNYIEYLAGDNNARALLYVKNLSDASLFLGGFKAERWNSGADTAPGHPNVIEIEDGNAGVVVIGAGKVHQGSSSGTPDAFILNWANTGSRAEIFVLGGITRTPTTTTYTNFYDDGAGFTVARETLLNRPVRFETDPITIYSRSGRKALEAVSVATADKALAVYTRGHTQDAFYVTGDGKVFFGSGSSAADASLDRTAANTLGMDPEDTFKTGRGATGSRPAAATVGQSAQWFDTTLNKPIWSDGTNWRDAAGTAV